MRDVRAPAHLLIAGGSSFVARALAASAARAGIRPVALGRAEMDVTDRAGVASRLADIAPAVVVNAAAYNDNDRAELEPDRAFAVNRDGPAHLADACASVGAWLVHLSTDSVFGDAHTEHGHRERATPAPVSVYGESKLAGENAVRERLDCHVVVRLTWQFGPEDPNFVGTVTRRALREREVRITTGQIGCPTPVARTADALARLVALLASGRGSPGTYHFCSTGAVTRMGLAELIVDELRRAAEPRDERLTPVARELVDRARRPRCSVLDCRAFTRLTGVRRPRWRAALRAAVRAIAAEAAATA